MGEHGHQPGPGQAWRDDWALRIEQLLRKHGHSSVTAFIQAHPRRSLVELATRVGGEDVAAVQLEWAYLDEARAAGTIEACARDLLVRVLHEHFPDGWQPDDDQRHQLAFSGWSAPLKTRGGARADTLAMWEALYDSAAPGWLPMDGADPLLVDIFRRYWRAS